jgi:L-histidine N-alpha-methyltransferase
MTTTDGAPAAPITIHSYLTPGDERTLADDVLDGLTRPFKELPPKHFYDERGAELFDRICELPEYYPTRAERSILVARAAEIAQLTQAAEVVELGSGTAEKTRILLAALAAAGTLRRYVPVDVTEAMVVRVADELTGLFDDLEVHGIVGDFERHLGHVPPPGDGPRIVAFLGGTIGNFTPGSRRRFLRGLARLLRPGTDHLLLGTDLVKDPAVLEAAYDDAEGLTAQFNRNVLAVLNRELGADFDLDAFEHVAFFDRDHEWIEMRLRARSRQRVTIPGAGGLVVDFAAREELRTEISAKFTPERLASDLAAAGLRLERTLTDDDGRFALSLSTPR